MVDFFQNFVVSRNTEILFNSNYWLNGENKTAVVTNTHGASARERKNSFQMVAIEWNECYKEDHARDSQWAELWEIFEGFTPPITAFHGARFYFHARFHYVYSLKLHVKTSLARLKIEFYGWAMVEGLGIIKVWG